MIRLTFWLGLGWSLGVSLGGAAQEGADAFEPDDTAQEAGWIGVGGDPQAHTFHVEEDEDWSQFHTEAGLTITIETINLGPQVDTVISVFGSDTEAPLAEADDGGETPTASLLLFSAPETGFYLVRVTNIGENFGGQATYELRVWEETGSILPSTIQGLVVDAATNSAIEGATVSLLGFGGLTATANIDGAFVFAGLPSGTFTVEAAAQGYEAVSEMVALAEGTIENIVFELEAGGEGEGEGEGPEPPNGCGAVGTFSDGAAPRKGDLFLLSITALLLSGMLRRHRA